MKTIPAETIEDVCYKLICHASIHLPPEVEKTFDRSFSRFARVVAERK